MGWQVGYDPNWERDVGYGVPAMCDHPGCGEEIDRGLSYVCGSDVYGGDLGCGLYFCAEHLDRSTYVEADDRYVSLCARCGSGEPPFDPTPDTQEWTDHKATEVRG